MIIKEISSLQNEIIKHLVKLREKKEYRNEQKSVVISGLTEIQELSHLHFKTLLTTDISLIPPSLKADFIYLVPEKVMQKASGLIKSEGLLGEVKMQEPFTLNGLKKIIALDQIRDPGNLGTIMRSALALNFEGVFILNGSVDPYNAKALSAAKGATFLLPHKQGNWKELKDLIIHNDLTPFIADIKGKAIDTLEKAEKILIIFGNESTGLSKEALEMGERITIPISSKMESLNVAIAAGIIMYSLRK